MVSKKFKDISKSNKKRISISHWIQRPWVKLEEAHAS